MDEFPPSGLWGTTPFRSAAEYKVGRYFKAALFSEDLYSRNVFAVNLLGDTLLVWDTEKATYTRFDVEKAIEEAYGAIPHNMDYEMYHLPIQSITRRLRKLCSSYHRFVSNYASGVTSDNEPVAIFRNGCVSLRTGNFITNRPTTLVEGYWDTEFDPLAPTTHYDEWMRARDFNEQLPQFEAVFGSIFDGTYRHPHVIVLEGEWEYEGFPFIGILNQIASVPERPYNVETSAGRMWRYPKETARWQRVPALYEVVRSRPRKARLGVYMSTYVAQLLTQMSCGLQICSTDGYRTSHTDADHRAWDEHLEKCDDLEVFNFAAVPEGRPAVDDHLLYRETSGIISRWIQRYISSGIYR